MALEDLINRMKQMIQHEKIIRAIQIIEEDARFRTPIDTGFLQNSTEITKKGNTYTLAYRCDYGIYVHEILEYSHTFGEAKFLERAWNAKKDEFFQSLLEPLR